MDPEKDKILDEAAKFEFEEVESGHDNLKSPQRWWRWNDSLKKRYNLRLSTGKQIERHLIDRLGSLSKVGWFLSIWLAFISLLAVVLLFQIRSLTPYYTELQPARGGIYTEGIVGRATNFNPIYATTEVDRSVSRLVFANLFDFDRNNQLQPVLAQSLEVNEQARQYTLTLKEGLKWHDGEDLNAADVVFTIETIKNPAARSPLRFNWQGVSIDKIDDLTIKFTLPSSFSPFATNLALAVLPQHLLVSEDIKQLRNSAFNYQPVGSGPFIFDRLVSLAAGGIDDKEFRIELDRNPAWLAINPDQENPLLDSLHLWVVPDARRLTDLFNQGRISGAFNLIQEEITLGDLDYDSVNLNLMNGVYLFFKNSSPYLQDLELRQAVVSSLNIAQLLASLNQQTRRIFGPLLPEHAGYNLPGRPPPFDSDAARRLLVDSGWQRTARGWFKDDQQLLLILTTQKDTPYETLAFSVEEQLERIGIEVELDLRSAESVSLEILQNHNYGDILIYGINLGSDADVYSYWHSSQIDSNSILRLNLSEYESDEADEALEVGRSRNEPQDRYQSYADFQRVWMEDLPALALYRFQLTYYTLRNVRGPAPDLLLINNSDRFLDVFEWAVVQRRRVIENDF